jgi:hypothetical protein
MCVWHSSGMYIHMYVQCIQGLFQSRLGTADYALVTSSLNYNVSLVTWTVIHMTAAKFKPLIFSVLGFALSNVAKHFHDFEWLLLVACMILLCHNKRTEFGKPHAYLEPMCASENCQWCGEPYFAVSAISGGHILPQIPRQGKHKSLRI